jgi:hypothetical protein
MQPASSSARPTGSKATTSITFRPRRGTGHDSTHSSRARFRGDYSARAAPSLAAIHDLYHLLPGLYGRANQERDQHGSNDHIMTAGRSSASRKRFAAIHNLCPHRCRTNPHPASIYDRIHYLGSSASSRLRSNRHLVDCAPSTGSAPSEPFEYRGQMRLRLETNCQRDLYNRHRSVPQQLFSALNSSSQEKLVGPQARRRPELGGEVHSAQSCDSSQIRQGDFF